MHPRTFRHLQLFCGLGGLSAGIQDAVERHAGLEGRWECLAAIDSDPATVEAYNRYTASDAGHVVDLFSREQFEAFHGHAPPAGWREASPATIRELCGGRAPHLVASSPPCKGFSGLLPERSSRAAKYQALNGLVFRGIWLVLEAFAADPPAFWLLENVPRIQSRGRHYLEQLEALFAAYGYSVTGDEHCCGEVGGLAQRRRRYLLVARHREKVPPLLYRPEARPLRTVGEVLGRLPVPGDPGAGTTHAPRRTAFRTALRLALIPPGKDWRALRDLRVVDGVLADYQVVPQGAEWHGGVMGVTPWVRPSCTITGRSGTNTGAYNVADPRPAGDRMNNVFRIVAISEPSPTVTAGGGPSAGGLSLADPRTPRELDGRCSWRGGGAYGVVPWGQPCGTVSASADAAAGGYSVADARGPLQTRARIDAREGLPEVDQLGVWLVISPHGGAWHRPFTTLELAALQSLVTEDDLEALAVGETSGPASLATCDYTDTRRRQWIGNAVPRATAQAIGGVVLRALLAAEAGESFTLSSSAPWALPRRVAAALAVEVGS